MLHRDEGEPVEVKNFFHLLFFAEGKKSKRNGSKWTDLVVGWG